MIGMKPINSKSKNKTQTLLLKQYTLIITDRALKDVYLMPVRFDKTVISNKNFNQASSFNKISNIPSRIKKNKLKAWLKIFKISIVIWLSILLSTTIFFLVYTKIFGDT